MTEQETSQLVRPQIIAVQYEKEKEKVTVGKQLHLEQIIEDMIKVHNACFPEKLKEETIQNFKSIAMFVLYEEKTPIGMFWFEQKTRDIAYMTSFAIIESHRRKGIGSKLFCYLRTIGCRTGVERILFDSYKSEENVTAFYKKQECKILDDTMKNGIIWATEPLADLGWLFMQILSGQFNGLNTNEQDSDDGGQLDNRTKEAKEAEEAEEAERPSTTEETEEQGETNAETSTTTGTAKGGNENN